MSVPEKYKHRYMYHFTHIDNLPAILDHGLLCTNEKIERGLLHHNVADEGIQERRHAMPVTCSVGGMVHDYVPFYLGSINPMLVNIINSKNVDQQDLLFFAIPLTILEEEGTVFTNASANTIIPPDFYENPNDLDKLNWEAIDDEKWAKGTDVYRHQRMAEVLVHNSLPADRIDTIIVWNETTRKKVLKVYEDAGLAPPSISYAPFKKRNFFLKKFMVKGKEDYSLLTGPKTLKSEFETHVKYLTKNKDNRQEENFKFADIYEALAAVKEDFCAIKELKGIYQLKTDNLIHHETVSEHTIRVVENVLSTDYYDELDEEDQCILELSAYLHDIGKGPAAKWKDGIQKAYPDHPADGVEMVCRFLYEDVKALTDYQIRKICLLVIYHDLIGEIFGQGRNKQQLKDLVETEHELRMLSALNRADVAALNTIWRRNYDNQIEDFIEQIVEETRIE